MLPSMRAAHSESGRKITAIARDMELSASTLHGYFAGRLYVPQRKRAALDRALRAAVDWVAYEREVPAEAKRKAPAPASVGVAPEAPSRITLAPPPAVEAQTRAVGARVAAAAPSTTPRPTRASSTPSRARKAPTDPADPWGANEPAAPRAAAPADPSPTAPRRGFLARLIVDDGDTLGA